MCKFYKGRCKSYENSDFEARIRGVNSVSGETLHDFEIICPAGGSTPSAYSPVIPISLPVLSTDPINYQFAKVADNQANQMSYQLGRQAIMIVPFTVIARSPWFTAILHSTDSVNSTS